MRGIKLDGKKEASLNPWTIHKLKFPKILRVPLIQSVKGLARPVVRVGDYVLAGQKIAEPDQADALPVFAGWSGVIKRIESFPHVIFGSCVAIEIDCDEDRKYAPEVARERAGWEGLETNQLTDIFKDAGLVELNQERIALHRKFECYTAGKISTLVINACEHEPYLTSDYCLMMSNPIETLKGIEILRKAAGAENVVVVFLDDKSEAAELFKSKVYFLKWEHIKIEILPTLYPQEAAAPLVKKLFNIDIISDVIEKRRGNPDESEDWLIVEALAAHEIAMHNVATAFSVFEAVVMQKPLYERAVTISGECVIQPHNFWLPFGYPIEAAFKKAKGFMREPGKVLMNGPMQGEEILDLDSPVTPASRGLIGLPKELTQKKETRPCTHCNDCVEVCPVDISPVMISLATERGLYEDARDWGAEACIFCGNCEYVCPSRRPLSELVEKARDMLVPGSGI